MKKAMIAFMLLSGALAFAQDSTDDFFSSSDDSLLDKARQKYEQRQSDGSEDGQDKERAKDLVKGDVDSAADEDATADETAVDGQALGDDEDSSADYAAVQDDEREIVIDIFGIDLIFKAGKSREGGKRLSGTARAEKREAEAAKKEAPYSPFVLSFLPGLSFPMGSYRTNLQLGAIGGLSAETRGITASGVFDIVQGDLLGIQSAGVFAIVGGNAVAIQSAGVFGVVSGDLSGIQAAGVFNVSRDLRGVQAAGVFNTARKVIGVQAAGIGNVADDVKGVQVAGIVNIADEVRGTQIGLLNISKEMYGLPIGLFNFTLNGIRDIGAWQDSSNSVYGFWANGSNNFYTIVYAGESAVDWFRDSDTLAAGFGVGARIIEKPLRLDLDLSAKQFIGPRFAEGMSELAASAATGGPAMKGASAEADTGFVRPAWCDWNPAPVFPSLRLTLGLPIFKKLELFGGVSADLGVQGLCEIPKELASGWSFDFQAGGRTIQVSPTLYWGLRF